MNIFISYGHNDHVKLVDRVFDALREQGHHPWKDDRYEGTSGIPAGADFTNVIYEAIRNSDFVIAFVSRSTKGRAYCIDERQYAYNKKGDHFIQIRLDYVEIELGNSRSYIDMSDVEEPNGDVNDKLFEQKIQSLFAAFRDPASFAEGGFAPWAKLDTYLKVYGAMKYDEFVLMPEKEDFVGREWLFDLCRSWTTDSSITCRVFVILGEAGTGKTAFVQKLSQDKSLVRSVHVCIYNQPSTRSARDTLKDLAYVLAQTNRSYLDYLKNRDLEKLRDMEPDGMFEYLFIEPLKAEQEKYLLIIDGLDELDEQNGFRPLMDLFCRYAHRINPNISFLLTGRPDDNILSEIDKIGGGKPPERTELNKTTGETDLKRYITIRLDKLGVCSEELAAQLLEACDGNFEYLSLLFKEAEEEGLDLNAMSFPKGLSLRYTQYFDRRMDMAGHSRKLNKEEHIVLSLLSVCLEPLPLSLLAEFAGTDEFDIEDILLIFGSLIRKTERDDGETVVLLFAKSLRDYLLSKSSRAYFADAARGRKLIAEYILGNCPTGDDPAEQPYLVSYGALHLLLYYDKSKERVIAYFRDLYDADSDSANRRLADALVIGGDEAVGSGHAVVTALGCQDLILRELKRRREQDALNGLCDYYEAIGKINDALILRGDILLWEPTPEAKAQAKELYRQACENLERAERQCSNYDTRKELAVAYSRLSSHELNDRTPETRKRFDELFRKIVALDEQNYEERPCLESRGSLAITYEVLGNRATIEKTKAGNERAEKWFRKALELFEINYSEKPCYETRRSLALASEKLGRLDRLENTPESRKSAGEWFKRELELFEKNYQDNPCFESRRSLAIAYDNCGSLARIRNTPAERANAEKWFLKVLELEEENYRENPCYESRRGLSLTYDRLGKLARAENTPEGRKRAEEWFLRGLEFDEQNYRDNPCYESRRSLSITYERIGSLAQGENTSDSRKLAEECFLKEMELDELNYSSNPCFETRKALAATYERLGKLERSADTHESRKRADEWFRRELELDEQNHRDNPGYESRRSLAVTYERLGKLALSEHTPDGNVRAKEWFLKKPALLEENYRESPDHETIQSLAATYERLRDLSLTEHTPEGDAQAEEWFRKEADLFEKIHQSNPNCYSRKRLASVYERLGAMIQSEKAPDAKRRAEEWFRKALELYHQNDSEKPSYNSRKDIASVYDRLGNLALSERTSEGKQRANEWFEKETALLEQNHSEFPSPESLKLLTSIYTKLRNLARTERTPEGDRRAADLEEKAAALTDTK